MEKSVNFWFIVLFKVILMMYFLKAVYASKVPHVRRTWCSLQIPYPELPFTFA